MVTTKNWLRALARVQLTNTTPLTGLLALVAFLAACTPAGPRLLLEGDLLLREKRYAQAAVKFEEAVRRLPTNAQAWNHLGLAYHYTGQRAAALKAYEQSRRCDPNLVPVRFNLGCLALEQSDLA